MPITEVSKYMKPARLAYFVNTAAMTRTTPYFDSNNNPAANWDAAVNAYNDVAVSLNTQSVILKDQIQYAVGRLDVQVRVSENTLYDSGSGVEDAADKEPQMVIAPNEGYQLTGVLIGGQKRVNWKFEPNGDTDYTIYDKEMTRDIYAKVGPNYNSEEVNHTLTLETHEGEATRICLEFVNNGKDFFGYRNKIIPSGSKFYLVATLKPGENEKVNSKITSTVGTDNKTYGFGSTTPAPTDEAASTSTTEGTKDDNFRELTRSGNIGVTTSAQLLEGELEVRKNIFIDIVMNDIDTIMCLKLY